MDSPSIVELVDRGLALEAERQAHWAKLRPAISSRAARIREGKDPGPPLPVLGKSNERVPEELGISRHDYYFAKRVVRIARSDPDRYGDILLQFAHDSDIPAAMRALQARGAIDAYITPRVKARHPVNQGTRRRIPATMMDRAVCALDGVVNSFNEFEIDSIAQATPEHCVYWEEALTQALRTIRRVLKEVKNHGTSTGSADERRETTAGNGPA